MKPESGVKQRAAGLLLAGLLALSMLAGCGKTEDGGELVFGRGIFYARASSDEEVFPDANALMAQPESGQVEILDGEVPLAALPEIDRLESAQGEGWMLVRYSSLPSGGIQPTWVGVWSEEAGWLEAVLDCGELGLRLLDAQQEP